MIILTIIDTVNGAIVKYVVHNRTGSVAFDLVQLHVDASIRLRGVRTAWYSIRFASLKQSMVFLKRTGTTTISKMAMVTCDNNKPNAEQ